jgi:hypothetical protein
VCALILSDDDAEALILRDGLEDILVPLKVLRWAVQEDLKFHPPRVWVAVCVLKEQPGELW